MALRYICTLGLTVRRPLWAFRSELLGIPLVCYDLPTVAPIILVRTRDILFDRLGSGAAVLCAIHCIGTPLLLAAFPVLVGMSEGSESALLVLSLGVSAIAIIRAAIVHGYLVPLALFGVAASLLGVRTQVAEGVAERVLVLMAASLLVAAHALNIRRTHQCAAHSPLRQ